MIVTTLLQPCYNLVTWYKSPRVWSSCYCCQVMHGADWDVTWLQRDFGIYIVNLFDTGQASRVLGLPKYSLAFLLDYCCKVQADKQYQLADWRIRSAAVRPLLTAPTLSYPVPSLYPVEQIKYVRSTEVWLYSHASDEYLKMYSLAIYNSSGKSSKMDMCGYMKHDWHISSTGRYM